MMTNLHRLLSKLLLVFISLHATHAACIAQSIPVATIDSILNSPALTPFNGTVLIRRGSKVLYSRAMGWSSFRTLDKMKLNDRFVIGSLSKQITATLVLREYDKGNLQLHIPIRRWLDTLPQHWADS